MASNQIAWTFCGILLVHSYALASGTDKGDAIVSSKDDVKLDTFDPQTSGVDGVLENNAYEHSLKKRYINGLTGDNDMGYPGYPVGFGYFQDAYQDVPEKRHASRWALIHRKLAELENNKRYNYYPMDSEINDDKRSPSRWRLIHNRLKQLQKRDVRQNYALLNE